MSREEKDKKNRQAGIYFSVGTHIAVLILFIFLVAWRAPNPPLPEFGIELNFGTSDQGTGEVQPETPANKAESEEEAMPDAPPEEVTEEVEEAVETPVEEVTEPVEAVTEEATKAVEEIVPVTEQETEAPVKKPEKKPEVVKKPVVEEKKEEPKPPKLLYPGKKDGAAGTSGDSKKPANANQGDKANAQGDQGDVDGSVDARSLYGNAGGSGDGVLEMAGWMWDEAPDPKETTSQSGKIVFEVLIDERGDVTSAKVISYTVSASLVKIYQAEVERLTFSKTTSGPAPPSSKGKITFIIKEK
jgi:periplasmic protein TonB